MIWLNAEELKDEDVEGRRLENEAAEVAWRPDPGDTNLVRLEALQAEDSLTCHACKTVLPKSVHK